MQRLEVSGAVRPLYGSLGVRGLNAHSVQQLGDIKLPACEANSGAPPAQSTAVV